MNASMSRRRLLGLAAAASAGAAIRRNLAPGGDAPPPAARPRLAVCIDALFTEGFRMVDAVGSPRVRLLFDIYHQQITEGHLIANITANIGKIAHFHMADVPGHHQPGTGEINYLNVFRAIAAKGFTGFLGLEMWPAVDHTQAVRESISLLAEATAERKQ